MTHHSLRPQEVALRSRLLTALAGMQPLSPGCASLQGAVQREAGGARERGGAARLNIAAGVAMQHGQALWMHW